MGETMKAVRLHAFGGPEVLRFEDAPRPEPQLGEVLIRVRAVGLNPPDWYLREGYDMLPPEWRPPMDFPIIPGTDMAGVVEKVADGVEGFAVGDEVYSMVRFPEGMAGESRAYAEYVTAPAAQIALKPMAIDFIHAAGAPMSLLTAWQYLIEQGHKAPNPLQPHPHRPVPLEGRTVLVNGAAGGVGHFAVQLAKWRGARVIAAASARNERLLLDLGADIFIDYAKTPPEDVVRDADLVIDAVGGPTTGRFLRSLRRGGALFPVFGLGVSLDEEAVQCGVTVSATQVRSSGAQLAEVAPLLNDGTVRVAIDACFPLSEAREAHARAAQGHIQGKLVLTL